MVLIVKHITILGLLFIYIYHILVIFIIIYSIILYYRIINSILLKMHLFLKGKLIPFISYIFRIVVMDMHYLKAILFFLLLK